MSGQPLLSGLGVLTVGLASLLVQAAPSLANPVIYDYGNYRSYPYPSDRGYSNFIYGSPIPAPVPVNPVTGAVVFPDSHNDSNGMEERVRQRYRQINNSVLIRPTVIDSEVNDSVLVYPTIVETDGYPPVYLRRSAPVYRYNNGYYY
jgi:hypothetical protein